MILSKEAERNIWHSLLDQQKETPLNVQQPDDQN